MVTWVTPGVRMHAFLSYQTADRHVAAKVRDILTAFGVTSFMAHDDIEVSAEWRKAILTNIRKADLFVAILSANYYASQFCM
jgi:TIR domain